MCLRRCPYLCIARIVALERLDKRQLLVWLYGAMIDKIQFFDDLIEGDLGATCSRNLFAPKLIPCSCVLWRVACTRTLYCIFLNCFSSRSQTLLSRVPRASATCCKACPRSNQPEVMSGGDNAGTGWLTTPWSISDPRRKIPATS